MALAGGELQLESHRFWSLARMGGGALITEAKHFLWWWYPRDAEDVATEAVS